MKVRIISAVVALLIVVPLIFLGGIWFLLGASILAALAYKEVIELPKDHGNYPKGIVFIGLVCLISLVLANNTYASIYNGFTYQQFALMVLVLLVPIIFYKDDKYSAKDAFYLIGWILFLGLVFNLFVIIRMRSLNMFLFLIVIPMINDIFAYLIGSKFGKNKMCKTISPNKTWEGSIGGLLLGSISGLVIYHFLIGSISIKIVFMVILLSVVGQIGDLVMSKIKRENKIKDFSNIMPGHGGILDRLDSIIFVFIAYIFLMII